MHSLPFPDSLADPTSPLLRAGTPALYELTKPAGPYRAARPASVAEVVANPTAALTGPGIDRFGWPLSSQVRVAFAFAFAACLYARTPRSVSGLVTSATDRSALSSP